MILQIIPTANVKVEHPPSEWGGCDFKPRPSHTKDLKNGSRYTQLSATTSLGGILITQMGGCLVGGCCVNFLYLNEKLNSSLITVQPEN